MAAEMAPETQGRISLNTTISVASSQLRDENGIRTLRYEETMEGKLPIPVTVPPPRAPPTEPHPALRNSSSLSAEDPEKRDSALAPQTSSTTATSSKKDFTYNVDSTNRKSENVFSPTIATAQSINATNVPLTMNRSEGDELQSPISTASSISRRSPKLLIPRISSSSSATDSPKEKNKSPISLTSPTTEPAFSPIDTQIPDPGLLETEYFQDMAFSKRGSLLFGSKKMMPSASEQERASPSAIRVAQMTATTPNVLSADLEEESQKVRSLYESADAASMNWRDGHVSALGEAEQEPQEQASR